MFSTEEMNRLYDFWSTDPYFDEDTRLEVAALSELERPNAFIANWSSAHRECARSWLRE